MSLRPDVEKTATGVESQLTEEELLSVQSLIEERRASYEECERIRQKLENTSAPRERRKLRNEFYNAVLLVDRLNKQLHDLSQGDISPLSVDYSIPS